MTCIKLKGNDLKRCKEERCLTKKFGKKSEEKIGARDLTVTSSEETGLPFELIRYTLFVALFQADVFSRYI